MIYVDPREGSSKFLKDFEDCEAMTLVGGDFAFFGNGPDDKQWFCGIEHKQVSDVVQCIQSGRFTGTQLPAMMRLYDICFLLVEGAYQPDYWGDTVYGHKRLIVPFKGNNGIRFGIPYIAFDNFLNSVAIFSALYGKPCIVKRSKDHKESVEIINDLHDFFQKPWEDHRSVSRPDMTKVQRVPYDMEIAKIEPDDAEYPKLVLRKALLQIKGFSWESAGHAAEKFGTMDAALKATQKDWEDIDRIGTLLAKRAYFSLHGFADTTVKVRKKKACE